MLINHSQISSSTHRLTHSRTAQLSELKTSPRVQPRRPVNLLWWLTWLKPFSCAILGEISFWSIALWQIYAHKKQHRLKSSIAKCVGTIKKTFFFSLFTSSCIVDQQHHHHHQPHHQGEDGPIFRFFLLSSFTPNRPHKWHNYYRPELLLLLKHLLTIAIRLFSSNIMNILFID